MNIGKLLKKYYDNDDLKPVSFGTSGHRGSSFEASFNELHIHAITQAIADYRSAHGVNGAVFVGIDTHALSSMAYKSALEVLVANGLHVNTENGYTPTPAISFMINKTNAKSAKKSDGIVITPSHNPPKDGGFKYNDCLGGASNSDVTSQIEKLANIYMQNPHKIQKIPYEDAKNSELLHVMDFKKEYCEALGRIVDMDAIKNAKIKIACDAMGGAGAKYWQYIKQYFGLDITLFNDVVDYEFSFMHPDFDGTIRMDCSSSHVMKGALKISKDYDIVFGNDTDFDRHGVVCDGVLMNSNHYLAVCIDYLLATRKWSGISIGKTCVSTAMIDKIVKSHSTKLYETPVGFKWFNEGLKKGVIGFGGEESAGGSFLDFGQEVYSNDKDGIVMCLLALEMIAKEGKNPAQKYKDLCEKHGEFCYERVDNPASADMVSKLKSLRSDNVNIQTFGGEQVQNVADEFGGHKMGGIKISTCSGWVALRPSGTEPIYKIYCESSVDNAHLELLKADAVRFVQGL